MRKRILVFCATLACSLTVGCGLAENAKPEQPVKTEEVKETEKLEMAEVTKESEKPEIAEVSKESEKHEVNRAEAFDILQAMTIGWNLGNSLDAHGNHDPSYNETCWGNPATTREMVDAIYEQGFNTIRVPVTWAEHLGPAPDYVIDEKWLNRVEEVVSYGLDNGMYVILDTHHEPDYWLVPDPEKEEQVAEELAAIWKQIAERFKACDEHLLFEGMNEPRTRGSEAEWNGGTKEERKVVNTLNKAFVDAVRATGGNNEERCLILCTYGNSVNYNTLTELEIPEDDHIMVAVHLYTPYFFTYEPAESIWEWDGSMKADIITNMQMVDKYLIQKNVPVIITEFGAVHKIAADGSTNHEQVLKWIDDYMETVNRYGMKCVWWDNGNYTGQGERFAIFDRRTCEWFDKEVADALIRNAMQ